MGLLDRHIYETHEWAKGYIYERFAIDVWDLPFLPKVDINIRYTAYDSYELEFVYYKKNGSTQTKSASYTVYGQKPVRSLKISNTNKRSFTSC